MRPNYALSYRRSWTMPKKTPTKPSFSSFLGFKSKCAMTVLMAVSIANLQNKIKDMNDYQNFYEKPSLTVWDRRLNSAILKCTLYEIILFETVYLHVR